MGWMGNSRTTQTTTPQVPAWVQTQVQNNATRAAQVADRPFQAFTGSRVAGLSAGETQARTLANNQVGAWRPQMDAANAAVGQSLFTPQQVTAQTVRAPTLGPAAQATAPGAIDVTGMTGTRVSADDISRYMNPWMGQVEDATLAALRRATDQGQTSLGQRFAASGAFGGSREAIARAELERAAMETATRESANLRATGFQTALTAANQDAQRGQEAGLFTAGARNSAAEAAAGRAAAASLFNANGANEMAMEGARLGLQADTTSATLNLEGQRSNQAAQEAAGRRALDAAAAYRGLAGDTARFGAADVALLNELGTVDRSLAQGELDTAYEEFLREQNYPLEMLAAYLSGSDPAALSMFVGQNTTGTTRDPARNLQAAGSFLQGVGSLFPSDRRLKTDVKPLGREPNGLAWYSFRYHWDEPGVTRVGVMAQDAPAHVVGERDGYLTVDYGAL